MNRRVLGALLFVVAAAIAGYFAWQGDGPGPEAQIVGFVGGEKRSFVENPKVNDLLRRRYGIRLDPRKAGSVEMVTDPVLLAQKPDFFWPASPLALDLARQANVKVLKDETIFTSPIVIYTWSPIADRLAERGIARPLGSGKTAYTVDTAKLIGLIGARTTWAALGVPELFGAMMIFTTDPNRSNSGNQFASLALAMLTEGDYGEPKLGEGLIALKSMFQRMGYAEHSSGDLFEQYLRTGMGAKPLIAGYESQLIEFAHANRDLWQRLETQAIRPVILYPEPTVFSSHIVLALTAGGQRLATALRDPEIQRLAWTEHGFRSGIVADSDPAVAPIKGIPATIAKVVPVPPYGVVDRMLRTLGN